MLIYESYFFVLFYDKENSIFKSSWKNSEVLTDEEFKKNLLEYARLAELHRPQNYLVDNQGMVYIIDPDIQEWVNKHIYPYTAHDKVQKFALVVPSDLFAAIAIEQVVDEGGSKFKGVQTRYFMSTDEALAWIVEK